MSYSVFTRVWWKDNPSPKHYLDRHFETEKEARAFCREWNEEHDPGRYSRKAEYEEN